MNDTRRARASELIPIDIWRPYRRSAWKQGVVRAFGASWRTGPAQSCARLCGGSGTRPLGAAAGRSDHEGRAMKAVRGSPHSVSGAMSKYVASPAASKMAGNDFSGVAAVNQKRTNANDCPEANEIGDYTRDKLQAGQCGGYTPSARPGSSERRPVRMRFMPYGAPRRRGPEAWRGQETYSMGLVLPCRAHRPFRSSERGVRDGLAGSPALVLTCARRSR